MERGTSQNVAHVLKAEVDPVHVGADFCEDGGLLEDIAALAGAKAHHTVDVPGAIRVLAVQGATGVSLWVTTRTVGWQLESQQ